MNRRRFSDLAANSLVDHILNLLAYQMRGYADDTIATQRYQIKRIRIVAAPDEESFTGVADGITITSMDMHFYQNEMGNIWAGSVAGEYSGEIGAEWIVPLESGVGDSVTLLGDRWYSGVWHATVADGTITGSGVTFSGEAGGTYDTSNNTLTGIAGGTWNDEPK